VSPLNSHNCENNNKLNCVCKELSNFDPDFKNKNQFKSDLSFLSFKLNLYYQSAISSLTGRDHNCLYNQIIEQFVPIQNLEDRYIFLKNGKVDDNGEFVITA